MFLLLACTPEPSVDLQPTEFHTGFFRGEGDADVDADMDADADADADVDVNDADHDGYADYEGDCNDYDARIFPHALDVCDDGLDNDCDGDVDEIDGAGPFRLYADLDGDGFGAGPAMHVEGTFCPLDGWSLLDTDCDDRVASRNPHSVDDTCDGIDDDCDGLPDDGFFGSRWWFDDADGDGFNGLARYGCFQHGSTEFNTDCDEEDPSINPSAEEIWFDGVDQNCDGNDDQPPDEDGDGFHVLNDCDDLSISVNPGAPESCGNGTDDDCDGIIDDDCVDDSAPYDAPNSGCNHLPRTGFMPLRRP